MDFKLSDDETMLRDAVARWLRDAYGFETREAGRAGDATAFARRNWTAMADLGVLAATLPVSLGGLGAGPGAMTLIAGLLGRSLAIEPYSEACVLAGRLLEAAPAGALREDLAARLISGETLLVPALSETAHGFAPETPATRAHRTAAGLTLTGRKIAVAGGHLGDALLVPADLDGKGMAILAVPVDAPGIERRAYETIDGRGAADFAFADVELAGGSVLIPPGAAAPALALALDHACVALCAEAVGSMDAVLEQTTDHLRQRRQFGRPLAEFQVLQHRMADMYAEADFARSMVFQAIAALEGPPEARARGVSAARVRIDRASHKVGGDAVHNHGGMGMTEELPVGHHMRRLMTIRMTFGDTDHHLDRVAA